MNKLKLISLIMFGMMVFTCEKSLAQTQVNKEQQTEQTVDTLNSDASQTQSTDPNTGTQPQSVTIDSTGGTGGAIYSSPPPSTGGARESTTKIHIYSGKQDGNNVINPDPKN